MMKSNDYWEILTLHLRQLSVLNYMQKHDNIERALIKDRYIEEPDTIHSIAYEDETEAFEELIERWNSTGELVGADILLVDSLVSKLSTELREDVKTFSHDANEVIKFIKIILKDPYAEPILFTLSDLNIYGFVSFLKYYKLGGSARKLYTQLDPAAIVYILFNSNEFRLDVKSPATVIEELPFYLQILMEVVNPAIEPFLNKQIKRKEMLEVIRTYSVYSLGILEMSTFHTYKASQKKRLVLFEHLMGCVTFHDKEHPEQIGEQPYYNELNFVGVDANRNNLHPLIAKNLSRVQNLTEFFNELYSKSEGEK